MMDVSILAERLTSLAARVSELAVGQKEVGEEFKDYRHSIRAELQRIVVDIERIAFDRQIRGKELDRLTLMVDGLAARIGSLETDQALVKWVWHAVTAIGAGALTLAGEWIVRMYGH